MTQTNIAINFLKLASSGDVKQAFDLCIHPEFTHHNQYFAQDKQSLLEAMQSSFVTFPKKSLEIVRTFGDKDLIFVHAKVTLSVDFCVRSVMYVFRLENDLIIEEWEVSQEVLKHSANINAMF
jgi:predicted SnoaL-like aldol condensation-catalyzing enzyme